MSRRRGQPKAEDVPSPDSLSSQQALCLVGQSRGSNIFEVTDITGSLLLAELPPRFRKNVWVRRGSYVIVSRSENESFTKVAGEIEHVVQTDQVKEWKRKGLWPSEFDTNTAAPDEESAQTREGDGDASGPGYEEGEEQAPRQDMSMSGSDASANPSHDTAS